MPAEPLRNRLRAWLQERLPLAEAGGMLTHKIVPTHNHSVWYYLGGVLLFALAVQMVTGFLLVVHYQASVPEDPNAAGAYESVQQIVNDLPHGWWIRSVHHWGSHLTITAAFIHMFSVMLLKGYRRPREFLWWTGLVLFALTLASGFTGYLLPWNHLSFAATRVGGSIAGATPLAGPLVRQILLAGPDVGEATLMRFFGLHVAIIPMLTVALAGIHVCLMAYHGSSVPPSVERSNEGNGATPGLRFWPEFLLRDVRVWLLVLVGLLLVVFQFPPALGERADPLAPTPEGIQPEWYFLAMFKTLKLLPTHALGLENMQLGVLGFAVIGLVLAVLPILHVVPGRSARQRRWISIQRRCLLLASFILAVAALTPPARLLLIDHWPGWWGTSAATSAARAPLLLGVVWLIPVVMIDRAVDRWPNGPATLFGLVLVSTCTGYTLWEAFGATSAVCGLTALLVVMLLVRAAGSPGFGRASKPAVLVSTLLLAAILCMTVPLGRIQEHPPAGAEATSVAVDEAATDHVPPDRMGETTSRWGAMLLVSVFLLVVVQRRIRHQRKLRDMGLMK